MLPFRDAALEQACTRTAISLYAHCLTAALTFAPASASNRHAGLTSIWFLSRHQNEIDLDAILIADGEGGDSI
jgi:hypothetical protein